MAGADLRPGIFIVFIRSANSLSGSGLYQERLSFFDKPLGWPRG